MLVRRATVADTRRVELMKHLYNQDNQAIETFLAHGPDVLTPSPLLAWQLALHKQPREPLEEHIWKTKMGALGKDLEDQKKRASDLERQVHLGGLKYTDTAKMLRNGQEQLEEGQKRLREGWERLQLEADKAQEKHEQELKALEKYKTAWGVAQRKAEQMEAKVAAEEAARQKAEKELAEKAAEYQREHTAELERRKEALETKYTQTDENPEEERLRAEVHKKTKEMDQQAHEARKKIQQQQDTIDFYKDEDAKAGEEFKRLGSIIGDLVQQKGKRTRERKSGERN